MPLEIDPSPVIPGVPVPWTKAAETSEERTASAPFTSHSSSRSLDGMGSFDALQRESRSSAPGSGLAHRRTQSSGVLPSSVAVGGILPAATLRTADNSNVTPHRSGAARADSGEHIFRVSKQSRWDAASHGSRSSKPGGHSFRVDGETSRLVMDESSTAHRVATDGGVRLAGGPPEHASGDDEIETLPPPYQRY